MERGNAVVVVLQLVAVASSTYYERRLRKNQLEVVASTPPVRGRPLSTHTLLQNGDKVSNSQVQEWLTELISGEEYIYGYRMLAECLRVQYQALINDKKVYRFCKELGILKPQRRKIVHYPRRLARNHTITASNQLWQLDIKYGYVEGYDQFFYLADMIDVYDRTIVGYHLGSSCSAIHICQTVKAAFKARLSQGEARPIIRTDNGPQFISKAFGALSADENEPFIHERIPPKSPNMNAYIESFHATLERDVLDKTSFETFEAAYQAVRDYIEFYNARRMHGSLGKRSPAAFMNWLKGTKEDLKKFDRVL
ncbi:IS3 family transposase [Cohnella abietis]|uniref:IS3 family transposase n=1 Tax=Cohnella abietis TaxID=2507935 RepID=UPI00102EB506|nr:IS3 family transposase [Cohnella abietis]